MGKSITTKIKNLLIDLFIAPNRFSVDAHWHCIKFICERCILYNNLKIICRQIPFILIAPISPLFAAILIII